MIRDEFFPPYAEMSEPARAVFRFILGLCTTFFIALVLCIHLIVLDVIFEPQATNLLTLILLYFFIFFEIMLLILIIIRGGSIRIRIDQLNLSNFTTALISIVPIIIMLLLLYILL